MYPPQIRADVGELTCLTAIAVLLSVHLPKWAKLPQMFPSFWSDLMSRITNTVLALFLSGACLSLPLHANAEEETSLEGNPVIVTVDRAKVFRISRPASTVIIGNPSIADATVEDDVTLVLTGRSFGVTNLIVLDLDGNPIVDETIVVRGHEANTVRIYRRDERVTLACAPICEPTLTIGDNSDTFEFAQQQIEARNALSESAK
jgi:hypothetical protein